MDTEIDIHCAVYVKKKIIFARIKKSVRISQNKKQEKQRNAEKKQR